MDFGSGPPALADCPGWTDAELALPEHAVLRAERGRGDQCHRAKAAERGIAVHVLTNLAGPLDVTARRHFRPILDSCPISRNLSAFAR